MNCNSLHCFCIQQGIPGRSGYPGLPGRKGESGELIGADGLKGIVLKVNSYFQSIVMMIKVVRELTVNMDLKATEVTLVSLARMDVMGNC